MLGTNLSSNAMNTIKTKIDNMIYKSNNAIAKIMTFNAITIPRLNIALPQKKVFCFKTENLFLGEHFLIITNSSSDLFAISTSDH